MIVSGKLTDYKSILKRQLSYEDKLDNKFKVELENFKFVVEEKLSKFDVMFGAWLAEQQKYLFDYIDQAVRASASSFALDPKFKEEILKQSETIAKTEVAKLTTAEFGKLKTDFTKLYNDSKAVFDEIGLNIVSKTDFDAAIEEINNKIEELPTGGSGETEEVVYFPDLSSYREDKKQLYIDMIGGVDGFNKIYDAAIHHKKIIVRNLNNENDENGIFFNPSSIYPQKSEVSKGVTLFGMIYNSIFFKMGIEYNLVSQNFEFMLYYASYTIGGVNSKIAEIPSFPQNIEAIRKVIYSEYITEKNIGYGRNTLFIVADDPNKGVYFGGNKIV